MSDTPRTDAAILTEPFQVRTLNFEVVAVDFASQLERELAASQAGQAKWQALAEGLATVLDDADGSSYHIEGDACLTPKAYDARKAALAAYEAAKAGLSQKASLDAGPGLA